MDCWSDSQSLEKVLSQGLCHNHPIGTSAYVETLGTSNGGIILLVRGSKISQFCLPFLIGDLELLGRMELLGASQGLLFYLESC